VRLARLRQGDNALPAVPRRRPFVNQPLLFEAAEDAAQIAGIETEFGRRRPFTLRQLPDLTESTIMAGWRSSRPSAKENRAPGFA